MFPKSILKTCLCLLLCCPCFPAAAAGMEENPLVQSFILDMSALHGMDANALRTLFSRITPNARVLKLIAPSATPGQRSWQRYRGRFLDDVRVNRGVEFWQRNAATLQAASTLYGVPEEIIVAIIGVETVYGRNTGNFNTLEALATLAFYYPPRAEFFRQELEQFLLLARENQAAPDHYKGSYAGALGLSQFMPGSQRRYAVDFDNDGKIDLQNSVADAIGSVAHFLAQHGWESNAPVTVPVRLGGKLNGAPEPRWLEAGIRPALLLKDLRDAGVETREECTPQACGDPFRKAALIDLVTPDEATEYWLGFDNFYVITRYNRSSFYAMAVYQLAQTLREAHAAELAAASE
jgi:membrane-bound lytic murein transglycosylase B